MPKTEIAATTDACSPDFRYGHAQQLFTANPGIDVMVAKEHAMKIMDCARYLNHTGVMLGDRCRVAASYHLNEMVRVLVDEIQK
ncbi:DUF3077 domain-containing protein [Pantoea sp. Ap-967]|uniref:DUF3077 domain-containing protein n=1 Tax=Pantoea sp. Ap-967 TaxID=2608362 RepID=UPI00141E2B92|nr:DUF3077 domain-containing protein [Pantoea sp. Ap-967]NIE78536.1 DUF3077 domain-containing protein [Pantoea sp. Ap-967]